MISFGLQVKSSPVSMVYFPHGYSSIISYNYARQLKDVDHLKGVCVCVYVGGGGHRQSLLGFEKAVITLKFIGYCGHEYLCHSFYL